MKNVTFVNGPLHNTDRILEDHATIYKCFELPEPMEVLNTEIAPSTPVIPLEHTYKEARPGSNIFIYQQ